VFDATLVQSLHDKASDRNPPGEGHIRSVCDPVGYTSSVSSDKVDACASYFKYLMRT